MTGIVACRDDDATISAAHSDGELRRRGGGQSDVEHIIAHAHQRAADDAAHHRAGDAGITPYYNLVGGRLCATTNEGSVS